MQHEPVGAKPKSSFMLRSKLEDDETHSVSDDFDAKLCPTLVYDRPSYDETHSVDVDAKVCSKLVDAKSSQVMTHTQPLSPT